LDYGKYSKIVAIPATAADAAAVWDKIALPFFRNGRIDCLLLYKYRPHWKITLMIVSMAAMSGRNLTFGNPGGNDIILLSASSYIEYASGGR
jgi:hypothetical protein